MTNPPAPFVEMVDISKKFGEVHALQNINICINCGEILA